MTYEEMLELAPEEFKLRETDKLAYRYPRYDMMMCLVAKYLCADDMLCYAVARAILTS
jgi:hypothetical protein